MSQSINDMISRAESGGTVLLPQGEFEGPVYITKPVRLVGNNTTLWARRGSVIEITCAGAAIENIRAELTEADSSASVIIAHGDTSVSNVEIFGGTEGFGAEDGYFDIPRSLYLGEFAAETGNTFVININVPTACSIECNTAGLAFTPNELQAGENVVTITAAGFPAGMLLYAEVLLKSLFLRRIFVSGRPLADIAPICGKKLYQCGEAAQQSDVFSMLSAAPRQELPPADIRKGQRISMTRYTDGNCVLRFSYMPRQPAEIDPYVFILDKEARAFGSTGMVFFGCEASDDGAVRYRADDGSIEIDFDKIDYRVDRILVAYSIYEDSQAQSFAEIKSPCCTIFSGGEKRISYNIYGLSDCATVIALEFYCCNGEWKAAAAGRGFRSGLAALCESFGIAVAE